MKTVGIIGGMGPAATIDFVQRLRRLTPARVDQDHLRLLIDDNPTLPNRNAALAGLGPSPGLQIAGMARGLERAGADFIVMPCNTAHAFRPEVEAAISIPFLSIVEATIDAGLAARPHLQRAGVMAVDGCRAAGLYQSALAAMDVTPVLLFGDDQAAFMALIGRIKAGDTGAEVGSGMRALAERLADEGAEVLLAACTEIPLVLDAGDLGVPLINSTEELAKRTLAFAAA